jgi:hypothetical protein
MKLHSLNNTVPKIAWVCLGLFLLSSLPAYSQATGFMGKRFFIEGQIGPSFNLSKKSNFFFESSEEVSGLTVVPGLSLNIVTTQHNYLGLSIDNRNYYQDIDNVFLASGGNNIRFKTQLRTYGLAYYSTRSKGGFDATLAPLGRFFGYKLTYHQLKSNPVSYANSGDDIDTADSEQYDLTYQNPEADFVGISIIYGYRTVVKERITLFITGELGTIGRVDPDYYTSNSLNRPLDNSQLDYYLGSYLNINLGAGLLLF